MKLINDDSEDDDKSQDQTEETQPMIVEIEMGLQTILEKIPASRTVDVQQLGSNPAVNRLGSGTRRSSDRTVEAVENSDAVNDLVNDEGLADSQPVEPEQDRSGPRTRQTVNQSQDDLISTPPAEQAAGTTCQSAGVVTQSADAEQPSQHQVSPAGFDPNFNNRPAIDVLEQPLRRRQEVRIVHPVSKETLDVTICNGFKRFNQKSWYRVEKPDGKREVLDFNEIVWDYSKNNSFFCKKARIDPKKTYVINHTIIHPKFHNQPQVIEAKAAEIKNHEKFGTFLKVKLDSLTEEQKQKIIPSVWASL